MSFCSKLSLAVAADAAAGSRQYMGTFWLVAGGNELQINHFCPLVRTGFCTQFHNTQDAGSTCDTHNPNSVHVQAEGICLVRR